MNIGPQAAQSGLEIERHDHASDTTEDLPGPPQCKGRHEVTGQPCFRTLNHRDDVRRGYCLHHSYVLVPYLKGPNSGAPERSSPPADAFTHLYQPVDAQILRFRLLQAQLRELLQNELALTGDAEKVGNASDPPMLLKKYGFLDILSAADSDSDVAGGPTGTGGGKGSDSTTGSSSPSNMEIGTKQAVAQQQQQLPRTGRRHRRAPGVTLRFRPFILSGALLPITPGQRALHAGQGLRAFTTIACRNPRLLALGIHCLLQDYVRRKGPPNATSGGASAPAAATASDVPSSDKTSGIVDSNNGNGGDNKSSGPSNDSASMAAATDSADPEPQVSAMECSPPPPLPRPALTNKRSADSGESSGSSSSFSAAHSQSPREFRSMYSMSAFQDTEAFAIPIMMFGPEAFPSGQVSADRAVETDPWFVVTEGDAYSAALEAATVIASELGLQDPADFFTAD